MCMLFYCILISGYIYEKKSFQPTAVRSAILATA